MQTGNSQLFDEVKRKFEARSGLTGVDATVMDREGSSVLVIKLANPNERLFRILADARQSVPRLEDTALATLVRSSKSNLLQAAEGRLLLRTLSESLNINRFSFQEDFLARYTRSVFGAEEQITASNNHVVFGRRGAGKSMLLLYAMHTRKSTDRPCVWIDMQVYAKRDDEAAISDVLRDLLTQTSVLLGEETRHRQLIAALQEPGMSLGTLRRLLPDARRLLSTFGTSGQELFVFLDDFHVIAPALQPRLLDAVYAIARGNQVFIKLSAIETLTRTFDPAERLGLEVPHDAQLIRLDYNLTMPEKASSHIEAILDSHAAFCGMPSIRRLCTSSDVVPRLTWVAAGVPRDALSLFSQAMTKAALAGRRHVSVSNINVAASEAVNAKFADLQADASTEAQQLRDLMEAIRDFCVKQQRKNAFLVEIDPNAVLYSQVRKLTDLRVLHVISEGLTVREAGRKYSALVLDYGFYTGVRAARSVERFNERTGRASYRDLRHLPVFAG